MDSAGNSSSMQSSSGGGGRDADEYDDPQADHAASFSAAAASSFLNPSASSAANLLMMGYTQSGLLQQQRQAQQSQQQFHPSFFDYSLLPQGYGAAEQAFPYAPAAPRPISGGQEQPGSTSGSAAAGGDHVRWDATDHSLASLMGLPTATQRQELQQTSTLPAPDRATGGVGLGNYRANQSETTSSIPAETANPPPPPTSTSQQVAATAGAAPTRASKKRPRASRRAPTTVLTTDTSNFRQMVQKFTGIPMQPFGPSGSSLMLPTRPSLSRMDIFAGNAGGSGRPSPMFPRETSAAASFLLRPFAQKAAAAAFPYGGSASSSTPTSSSSILAPASIVPPTTSGGGATGGCSAMTVLPSSNNPMIGDRNTNIASTSAAAGYGLLAPSEDHMAGGASSGGRQVGLSRPLAPPQNPGFTFQSLLQQQQQYAPQQQQQQYRYYSPSPPPPSQQIQQQQQYGASSSAGAGMIHMEWVARVQASTSNSNIDGGGTPEARRTERQDASEGPPQPSPSATPAASTTRAAADDVFAWIGSE